MGASIGAVLHEGLNRVKALVESWRRLYRTRDVQLRVCMLGLLRVLGSRGPMLLCVACMLTSQPASV